jgi:hypothetical protein
MNRKEHKEHKERREGSKSPFFLISVPFAFSAVKNLAA